VRAPWAALVAAAVLADLPASAGQGDMTDYDPGVGSLPPAVDVEKAPKPRLILPIGPLLIERGPGVDRTLFFPLFFHQKKKGSEPSTFLGVAPLWWYYRGTGGRNQRGDVVFPLWWYFAGGDRKSAVVPPFFLERWAGDGSFRAGLAPLVFVQRTPKLDYTVIPPIAWHFGTERLKFVMVVPYYYHRKLDMVNMGFPPLFFNGWSSRKEYLVLFPILWHFGDKTSERSDTVAGPMWIGKRGQSWQYYLFPSLYFQGGKNGPGLDIFPLVHWDTKDGGTRVVTPLGWYWKNVDRKVSGGGLLLYHRYRQGDFLFQTFAPLWFGWQSENMMRTSHLVVPVGYFDRSPIERNISILGLWWDFHRLDEHRTLVLLPLFAHSKDLYRTNHTTWVFPTFQYTHTPEDWQFNMHPVLYVKGGGPKTHQVFFPLWWRFVRPEKIHQVAFPLWWDFQNLKKGTRGMTLFPLFWRFDRPSGTHTVVANTYHWKDGDSYRFVFFPLFGFGKDEDGGGKYWKVLLGLVGWRSAKTRDTLYLLWLPIKVKDRTPAPGPG